MKQKDKSKSTWVAATLLAGAVFILSVALQHWPTDTLLPTPITPEHLTISKLIDSPVLVGEIEQIVAHTQDDDSKIEENLTISFSEKFRNARQIYGPSHYFEWNGNKYSTNRADDILILHTRSIEMVLDTISKESTLSASIRIAP